jgi:hypothetical protein
MINRLTNLKKNKESITPANVKKEVDKINTRRCRSVLPAINAYFKATAEVLNNRGTLLATRPNNC